MLIYIQWTRANPQGWEPYDITRAVDVRKLPDKGEPTAVFDPLAADADDPGWVHGVMCQGVTIMGFDHYSPRMAGARIELVCWNDDPVDWPPGMRWAVVWGFANPRVVDTKLNTEQYLTVYDEQGRPPGWYGTSTTGGPVLYDTWANFVVPADSNLNRHGIWTEEALNLAHQTEQAATPHGWREWVP